MLLAEQPHRDYPAMFRCVSELNRGMMDNTIMFGRQCEPRSIVINVLC